MLDLGPSLWLDDDARQRRSRNSGSVGFNNSSDIDKHSLILKRQLLDNFDLDRRNCSSLNRPTNIPASSLCIRGHSSLNPFAGVGRHLLELLLRHVLDLLLGAALRRDVGALLERLPASELCVPLLDLGKLVEVDAGPGCLRRPSAISEPVSPRIGGKCDPFPVKLTGTVDPTPAGNIGDRDPVPDDEAMRGFLEVRVQDPVEAARLVLVSVDSVLDLLRCVSYGPLRVSR